MKVFRAVAVLAVITLALSLHPAATHAQSMGGPPPSATTGQLYTEEQLRSPWDDILRSNPEQAAQWRGEAARYVEKIAPADAVNQAVKYAQTEKDKEDWRKLIEWNIQRDLERAQNAWVQYFQRDPCPSPDGGEACRVAAIVAVDPLFKTLTRISETVPTVPASSKTGAPVQTEVGTLPYKAGTGPLPPLPELVNADSYFRRSLPDRLSQLEVEGQSPSTSSSTDSQVDSISFSGEVNGPAVQLLVEEASTAVAEGSDLERATEYVIEPERPAETKTQVVVQEKVLSEEETTREAEIQARREHSQRAIISPSPTPSSPSLRTETSSAVKRESAALEGEEMPLPVHQVQNTGLEADAGASGALMDNVPEDISTGAAGGVNVDQLQRTGAANMGQHQRGHQPGQQQQTLASDSLPAPQPQPEQSGIGGLLGRMVELKKNVLSALGINFGGYQGGGGGLLSGLFGGRNGGGGGQASSLSAATGSTALQTNAAAETVRGPSPATGSQAELTGEYADQQQGGGALSAGAGAFQRSKNAVGGQATGQGEYNEGEVQGEAEATSSGDMSEGGNGQQGYLGTANAPGQAAQDPAVALKQAANVAGNAAKAAGTIASLAGPVLSLIPGAAPIGAALTAGAPLATGLADAVIQATNPNGAAAAGGGSGDAIGSLVSGVSNLVAGATGGGGAGGGAGGGDGNPIGNLGQALGGLLGGGAGGGGGANPLQNLGQALTGMVGGSGQGGGSGVLGGGGEQGYDSGGASAGHSAAGGAARESQTVRGQSGGAGNGLRTTNLGSKSAASSASSAKAAQVRPATTTNQGSYAGAGSRRRVLRRD